MTAHLGDGTTELGAPDLVDEPQVWPVHASADIWRGSAPFAVRRDEISRPGHAEQFGRVVVEHPGAVVVLALDEDGRALVLRQYRHPIGRRMVELPAGLLDVPGEDPLVAAQRELLEEAGLEAGHWTHLSSMHTSPGISAELIEVYLAQGLRAVPDRGGFEPEHEEADMTVHWVPFDDLVDAVLERRLTDGPLAVAVLTHVLLDRRHRDTAS
ncbi:NUDIX hydrolase [Nocardioides marmoribigeumensis]|uniref:ADP-ribose pyrophosphatase n=1 Tax=Nocardioides marmoribigeumensis TaxID=433649 RepID=A0ABU2BU95_9ACTN|nr:NUDIX hydrolase [Nocardioides marmoribigeumensis]MDR7360934.1 ADP-ribose pyrophosphatase [Nocardioides marmoribigeumensis]